MTGSRNTGLRALSVALIVAAYGAAGLTAQSPAGATLETAVAPGANYDKAEFRLWYPASATALQAVVVLVPGSNGDGRAMVDDSVWRAFAVRHNTALLGCRFTDKPHEQGFIEDYVNVGQGSGQALLDALSLLAGEAKHPELAGAPLMLWGMSAGGEFDYEFTAWKPERVIAFVVNKGGIYYTALASRAARNVPGLLFIGEKDLKSRIDIITGLFAVNRRGGALWALTEEPGLAHVVGRSRDLGATFFEDVLALRLAAEDGASSATLRPLSETSGWLGDLDALAIRPAAGDKTGTATAVWLPTERVARAWLAVVSGKPFPQ